ncbi:hypothetical protein [Christensenella intestinihominis]|uniref:hypothetical protein n=1 Tax=Christensenella intestinihominis TaxID=1851429 RepID=UPI00082FD3FD|nr:hypothetical protein [Christensenella intestinihominis]
MPIGSIDPTNQINTSYPTGNTQAASNTNGSFAELLSNYMALSASSIGSFNDTGSDSYMNGVMGMGGASSLMGMGGSSSEMFTMLLLLLLMGQKSQGSLGNLLAGSSGISQAQQYCQHNYIDPYTQTAAQGIPSQSWLEANPLLTNHVGERNASTYRAVIDQFHVETNERYRVNKSGSGDTYCNIFAWDVTRAMGAEVPHYISASGAPASSGQEDARELDANGVNDWLNTYGQTYGWRKVSPEEAQQYANMGMPAVTSWKNSSGHGHLQVVSPSADGSYDAGRGVAIAQAGRQLKNYDYASCAYSSQRLAEVEYFVHI